MNAKLESILDKGWNEPRHFFFWLTLLGAVGFGVAFGVSQLLTRPSVLVGLLALLGIIIVPLGFLAFVLSWIPPVRRGFAWLLRRRFLALAIVVTLLALAHTIENWRGQRAWNQFRAEWEAKGEEFDLAKLAPPEVPDEQNFFAAPIWKPQYYEITNGTTHWPYATNWFSGTLLDVAIPSSPEKPKLGSVESQRETDLSAWQAFYRGPHHVEASRKTTPDPADFFTNYFPVAAAPQSPAADVLLALSRFEDNRRALLEAARRPQARFRINYEDGFGALLPHVTRMRPGASYLALHAVASLEAGDNPTALEDVKLSFRLMEAIRSEPILISYLVRIALFHITLQPVWEGLAERRWSEAELLELERELAKLDFLADHHSAMRGERAFSLWAVDYMRRQGFRGYAEMMDPAAGDAGQSEAFENTLGAAMFRFVPRGWFDQNRLSLARMHTEFNLPMVNLEQRLVLPDLTRRAKVAVEQRVSRVTPYNVFSGMLLPALTTVAQRSARAQTFADLARVAIALERHRLTNGNYPQTLDALMPRYLAVVPHDVINGEPLHYRLTEDGRFVLYSVGWNERDDGGEVAWTKGNPPTVDLQQGDWVWRYPAE